MAGMATKKRLAREKRQREIKSLSRIARRIEKEGLQVTESLLEGLDDGWEHIRNVVIDIAGQDGNWAGYPLPMDDVELEIEPRHPLYKSLNGATLSEAKEKADGEPIEVINTWIDRDRGRRVVLYRENGQTRGAVLPEWDATHRGKLILDTIGASRAWSVRAEFTALTSLKALVTPVAFRYYLLTGTFLETSPRSKIIYMFRKLRPTLAIARCLDRDDTKFLAALCMHPIGYYRRTFAGSMVPTDDVIAHLLLMRADERKFWAKCNVHDIREPEAGV